MKVDYNIKMILCDKSCFSDLKLKPELNVFSMDNNSTIISKLMSLLSIGYKNIIVIIDDRIENTDRIEFISNFIGEYRKDNYKIIKFSNYN